MTRTHDMMKVCVPVANLRRQKSKPKSVYEKDPQQETQLLFNEVVIKHDEEGEWVYVEALQQQKFYPEKEKWSGYLGWVEKNALHETVAHTNLQSIVHSSWAEIASHKHTSPTYVSMGTELNVVKRASSYATVLLPDLTTGEINVSDLAPKRQGQRGTILGLARMFLDTPYHWGGCSAYWNLDNPYPLLTGVDCSGLTHLVYKVAGIQIPRDAIDQYRKASKISPASMNPGDLIFHAPKERPEDIDHVMLYAGGENLIEATMQYGVVREVSFEEKFDASLASIIQNGYDGDLALYFGICG